MSRISQYERFSMRARTAAVTHPATPPPTITMVRIRLSAMRVKALVFETESNAFSKPNVAQIRQFSGEILLDTENPIYPIIRNGASSSLFETEPFRQRGESL